MAQAKCSVYSRHISTARTEDTCSNIAITFRGTDLKAEIHRKHQINFADLKPQEGNCQPSCTLAWKLGLYEVGALR